MSSKPPYGTWGRLFRSQAVNLAMLADRIREFARERVDSGGRKVDIRICRNIKDFLGSRRKSE